MSVKRRVDTGRYEVRWRESGRHRSKSFSLRKDALAFDREIERRKRLGTLHQLEAGEELLADFVERWWQLHAIPNLEANTRAAYATTWDRHVLPRLGGYRLHDISPMAVDQFRVDLERAGVGAPTIRKALAVLQSVLGRAVLWGALPANPVAAVAKPTARRTRAPRALPPARIEQIRDHLQPIDAALVSLLAYAGLRPGEALALQWGEPTRTNSPG